MSFHINFLSSWSTDHDKENTFKQILDVLVQDLLATLNLPEWPAAELLLYSLVCLLVKQSNSYR